MAKVATTERCKCGKRATAPRGLCGLCYQRSERARVREAKATPKQLRARARSSGRAKRWWANATPAQRRARSKKAGDAIRRAWASKTPEQRSEIARVRYEALSDKKKQAFIKSGQAAQNVRWSKMTKVERLATGRKMADARIAKSTPEERSAQSSAGGKAAAAKYTAAELSAFRKAGWAKVPAKVRARYSAKRAATMKIKWSEKTLEERRAYGEAMKGNNPNIGAWVKQYSPAELSKLLRARWKKVKGADRELQLGKQRLANVLRGIEEKLTTSQWTAAGKAWYATERDPTSVCCPACGAELYLDTKDNRRFYCGTCTFTSRENLVYALECLKAIGRADLVADYVDYMANCGQKLRKALQ